MTYSTFSDNPFQRAANLLGIGLMEHAEKWGQTMTIDIDVSWVTGIPSVTLTGHTKPQMYNNCGQAVRIGSKIPLVEAAKELAPWMSAALSDDKVCAEMKVAASNFLAALHPHLPKESSNG